MDAKFGHCLGNGDSGVENTEIWVIVIQIARELWDICEIKAEICHICTLCGGHPYTESDFSKM